MVCQADGKGFSQSTGVTYMYELVSQETNANMLQKNHEVLKYMGDNSHLKALQRWEDGFVMQKHYSNVGVLQDNAMPRKVTESAMIGKVKDHQVINTKSEWRYFCILRAVVSV